MRMSAQEQNSMKKETVEDLFKSKVEEVHLLNP